MTGGDHNHAFGLRQIYQPALGVVSAPERALTVAADVFRVYDDLLKLTDSLGIAAQHIGLLALKLVVAAALYGDGDICIGEKLFADGIVFVGIDVEDGDVVATLHLSAQIVIILARPEAIAFVDLRVGDCFIHTGKRDRLLILGHRQLHPAMLEHGISELHLHLCYIHAKRQQDIYGIIGQHRLTGLDEHVFILLLQGVIWSLEINLVSGQKRPRQQHQSDETECVKFH